MRRAGFRASMIAALVAALAGCSRDRPAPTGIVPPPAVQVTPFPAARSQRVALDTPIYADFDVDLDPASLTATNLFLKIDEARYTIAISWDAAARRLTLVPAQLPLAVGRTYTVELTSRVRRASGEPLFPGGWFWQFSTTSIRALRTPDPPDRATGVSPFMRLRWDATEASAGTVVFRVFWGADSSGVAQRQASSFDGDGNRWVPRARWGDAEVFWAVRATNLRTGEVLEGPVWRFQAIPFASPTQSTSLAALAWGSASSTQSPACGAGSTPFGPGITTMIRFALPPSGTRLNLIEWNVPVPNNTPAAAPTMRAVRSAWTSCQLTGPNAPVPIGTPLASGRRTGSTLLFSSDTLTAFLEAAGRDGNLHGFAMECNRTVSFLIITPSAPDLGGLLMRYYP